MVPSESSKILAEKAIEQICDKVPVSGLRSIIRNLVIALLDDRLREVMRYATLQV